MDEENLASITKEISDALAPVVLKLLERSVRAEVERRVHRMLVGEPAAATKPSAAPASPRARKKARGELSLEAVRAALLDKPEGLLAEKLRVAMGLPDSARRRLALVLSKAVAAKQIVRKGQKRGATYFLKK
jgi:hypothetical protein